jgi:hypothetical protein
VNFVAQFNAFVGLMLLFYELVFEIPVSSVYQSLRLLDFLFDVADVVVLSRVSGDSIPASVSAFDDCHVL